MLHDAWLHPVNFFPQFHLEVDSIYDMHWPIKWLKNLIANKKQQELKVFYAPKQFARSIIT